MIGIDRHAITQANLRDHLDRPVDKRLGDFSRTRGSDGAAKDDDVVLAVAAERVFGVQFDGVC